MNYGDKLKELRERNNLSQYALADILNIKRSSYNQFEQQYDIIPIKRLIEVADYFDVSIDYILGLNDIKSYGSYNKVDLHKSGMRIKTFRKENKITQVALANTLNTAQAVIANYEKGRNLISTSFLYDVGKKYHVSADWLLGRVDSPMYFKNVKGKFNDL